MRRAPPTIDRALSLLQPYATLLALGVKVHETRSWTTPYRGWLAIHASRRYTGDQRADAHHVAVHLRPHVPDDLPCGALVGVGRLVDVRPVERVHTTRLDRALGTYTAGRFAWRFADVQLIDPLAASGSLGLWYLTPALQARLRARFGKT
jgi:activating signal cointegrator 1